MRGNNYYAYLYEFEINSRKLFINDLEGAGVSNPLPLLLG